MAKGNHADLIDTNPIDEAISALAGLERPSASVAEAQAARLIGERFEGAGARTEYCTEPAYGNYWRPLSVLMLATLVAGRIGRRAGTILGLVAFAGAWNELVSGRRVVRRLLLRRQSTTNVLGEYGPRDAGCVLIITAHHDAARTGAVFYPPLGRASSRFWRRFGSTPPIMWPVVMAPFLVTAGAISGNARLRRMGRIYAVGTLAAMRDIARRPVVAGANDNLSGVGALVGIAAQLCEHPPTSLRVVLLSTGAEETGLEGMWAFGRRTFTELDKSRTHLVCLDAVGSDNLVLARREGLLHTSSYSQPLMERITHYARDLEIELQQPVILRSATDGYVALKAGISAALIGSVDESGAPANYHWPTDIPKNLNYASIRHVVRICIELVRDLDAEAVTPTSEENLYVHKP